LLQQFCCKLNYFDLAYLLILTQSAVPRPSLTTGPDTERNLANDVTSIGNLFSISDVPKQKKTKCEELSVLKTMQAITIFACTAVLVKQLK